MTLKINTMRSLTQKLERKINIKMENKWRDLFARQARHKGNGVYFIPQTNLFSTDTRELFLMFVAAKEGIKIPEEE